MGPQGGEPVQDEPRPDDPRWPEISVKSGDTLIAAGSLLDLLELPLVLVDAELRVRGANRVFANLMGIEPPMPGGQRFTDLLEPSSRDWLRRRLPRPPPPGPAPPTRRAHP